MKKLLGIVVLSLLLSGNAYSKEIKISHKDKNSISITYSLWSEANMREIAANHCGKYQKSAFTFGLINKQGVPDDKGRATRLYHCSKKFLNNDPLTGKDNLDWTNHESNSQVTEKTKENQKVVKAEKIKLKCQGVVGAVFGDYIYVNFDKNFIEVVQGSGGNKVKFKVNNYDEYFIESHWRVLEEGLTGFNGDNYSYKTSISDWNEWYSVELKKSLWGVKIDRMEGLVGIGVTLEPYKIGKKKYNVEEAYNMKCQKRGFSKF